MYMYACKCMNVCMHACACMHVRVCTYVRMHAWYHGQTHTHTQEIDDAKGNALVQHDIYLSIHQSIGTLLLINTTHYYHSM